MRKPKVYSENAHLLRDEKWLRLQYIDNNLSLRMIASLIPCASLTIRRVLSKFNIPIKQKHITYGDITYPPRKGENSATWKGGNNKCIDCNSLLATRIALRCKKCQGILFRGENNPSWKPPEECVGGEAMQARNSVEYKEWRLSVWIRDKTKCQICGIRKDPMVAHHLDGFNLFPEKRFDVDNGVTLCDYHHIAFHSNYGFGNNTKEQFEDFKIRTTEMTY
jgi:hypothetical protein